MRLSRWILPAATTLALAACQPADQTITEDAADGATTAEDVASDASASADGAGAAEASGSSVGSGGGSGSGTSPQSPRDIGAPPPINGGSPDTPTSSGPPTRRPEDSPLTYGQRPLDQPTTENLARPDTVMPPTTPDGRPGI